MSTEHSTYTYMSGEQETATLKRGTADPHGHALLRIKHDDGKTLDCYVNTAWLRDRLDELDPRPLTAREHLDAAWDAAHVMTGPVEDGTKAIRRWEGEVTTCTLHSHAAMGSPEYRLLDPPTPARPEGAEEIEALIRDLLGSHPGDWYGDLADHLASHLTDPTRKEA